MVCCCINVQFLVVCLMAVLSRLLGLLLTVRLCAGVEFEIRLLKYRIPI